MAALHRHGRGRLWTTALGLFAVACRPVCALFEGMPGGAPDAPKGGRPAPRCPADAYQDAPVVFTCEGSGGEVGSRVLLAHFREQLDFGVPRGVTDLTVTLNSSNTDADIIIYDPLAGVWVKDHLGFDKYGTSKGTYEGMEIEFTATNGEPTAERAVLKGAIPTSLQLSVKSYSLLGAEFVLGYSYGPVVGDCVPSALAGCRKFDAAAAREAATQWSRWASSSIPSVEEAWSRLAAQYAEIDQIPWHRWCNVWALWPASENQAADCKAAFKFITGGGKEMGVDYVDKVSFTFAFNLAKTAQFSAMCCSQVRMTYPDEAQAWAALTNSQAGDQSQAGVGIINTIFSVCAAAGNPLGATEADSLKAGWSRYIEENQVPGMQAQEFHSCWMTGQECPRYNYYRTQALLFGCQPERGHSAVLLPPGPSIVGEIPRGLLNLNLTLEVGSGGSVDLALKDTQGGGYAAKATGGACDSDKLNCKFHGAKLGWTGNVGSSSSIEFKDPTPTTLSLEVDTGLSSVSMAKVTYSYGGYAVCPNEPDSDEPDAPAGCSYLDLSRSPPKACSEFSAFLELKHTDVAGLLAHLRHTQKMQSTAIGSGVPFHIWPTVWEEWPGKKDAAGDAWQQCFHWCDGNHDGLIDDTELKQCFFLSRTHEMVDSFCEDLCHTFPNEKALWATWANGAETILAGRWESLWQNGAHVHTEGVSPEHSFRYVDKDGNGAVTKTEFKACYNTGNCGPSWPTIGQILAGAGAHGANHRVKESPKSATQVKIPVAAQATPVDNGAAPAGSSGSSGSMPIWVLPLIIIVLIVLGLVMAMAVAPFFFRSHKKRSSISSIGEEEAQLDMNDEHDRAYSNLGVIDGPEQGQRSIDGLTADMSISYAGPSRLAVPTSPSGSLMMAPVARMSSGQMLLAPMNLTAVNPVAMPVQAGGAPGGAPITTFVPYPQRGQQPGSGVLRR